MDNLQSRNTDLNTLDFTTVTGENKLLRSAFAWMALAMVFTSVASLLFYFVPQLQSLLVEETATQKRVTTLAYVVMFAPLIFVFLMGMAFRRLSYPALVGVFVAFSIVNGISLSFIFHVYHIGSIVNVFLSTTALFAVMAIAGYTTKTDLTKLGSLLMIGLVGILIASLINFFTHSAGLDYLISILGVIIFTGLTAYDVQKIKNIGIEAGDASGLGKISIMAALTLYLDFINLFLFLLRLFGGKKD